VILEDGACPESGNTVTAAPGNRLASASPVSHCIVRAHSILSALSYFVKRRPAQQRPRSTPLSAFAVASGPFAAAYWATFGLAAIAVISRIFGSREQRIVTGAVVFSLVVIRGVARYVIAARIQRRSDASSDPDTS